jgi:signal recognition particle subunit SRP54
VLGMGDILSLVEEARKGVDEAEAKKLAEKFKKGKGFDLEDFKGQLAQMKKMGGMQSLIDKLPAQFAQAAAQSPQAMDDSVLRRLEGIINSMTPGERAKPELIKASRKRRIATGSGVTVQEVNRLLNQFEQMQKVMKTMQKGGLAKMMRSMKGMMGRG